MNHAAPSHGHAPKRLAIFGCGYVGSALACEARHRGWHVLALTRNAARGEELRAHGVEVVAADLAGDDWHETVSREQDLVVNCVSSGGGGLPGYWRSYVDGTKSILRWAAHGVPATYVYTSSTSVYGQGGGEVVTEESATGGGSEAAEPLLVAERLVREATEFRRVFILRLAGIYGPGRHYLVDQLRSGATLFPGTGAHRLNLAHRDDIVGAIVACLLAPAGIGSTVFNVADDTPTPKGEVASWLAQQLGVAPPQFAHDLAEPPPSGVSPVRGRSGPVPDRIISNARLKRVLHWSPRYPDYRAGYEAILGA
ncbi:MAG: NAD-dependent epimerase/dehydratase family protein [Opitutaceae bacterium]|nr:NAD-dependent epimerase/dehydratase family protein [Opitutaceae bacterium]